MFEVVELYRNGTSVTLKSFKTREEAGTYRYERSRDVQQLSSTLRNMLLAGVPGYRVMEFLDGLGFNPMSVQGHQIREV